MQLLWICFIQAIATYNFSTDLLDIGNLQTQNITRQPHKYKMKQNYTENLQFNSDRIPIIRIYRQCVIHITIIAMVTRYSPQTSFTNMIIGTQL